MIEGKASYSQSNPGDVLDKEKMKQIYHVADQQISEAIDAVGNDKSKVENYLRETYKNDNTQTDPKDIAVNPNPRANANITEEIQDKTSSQLKDEQSQPGNEITDGEDG
jgi:hypothetical protein